MRCTLSLTSFSPLRPSVWLRQVAHSRQLLRPQDPALSPDLPKKLAFLSPSFRLKVEWEVNDKLLLSIILSPCSTDRFYYSMYRKRTTVCIYISFDTPTMVRKESILLCCFMQLWSPVFVRRGRSFSQPVNHRRVLDVEIFSAHRAF